jgi:hypothetical protein
MPVIFCYYLNMCGYIKDESPVGAGLKRLLTRYKLDRPAKVWLHYSIWSSINQAFTSLNKSIYNEVESARFNR